MFISCYWVIDGLVIFFFFFLFLSFFFFLSFSFFRFSSFYLYLSFVFLLFFFLLLLFFVCFLIVFFFFFSWFFFFSSFVSFSSLSLGLDGFVLSWFSSLSVFYLSFASQSYFFRYFLLSFLLADLLRFFSLFIAATIRHFAEFNFISKHHSGIIRKK